ncbi:hypothetical protein JTB14_015943 [Gonioctena quinquepunctata]|nr:hypothetical protein JTB14_015943 [Gonioctena quinquepunctata]
MYEYKNDLFAELFRIDSQGEELEKKILDECRTIKICCAGLAIYCTLTYLSFFPFIGDDEKFLCQYAIGNYFIGGFHNIFVFPVLIILSFACTTNVNVLAHIVLHFRFQFMLLNKFAENLTKSGDPDMINSIEYQDMVYNKLTKCVKHHLKIKK